jgi:hypothetical protein
MDFLIFLLEGPRLANAAFDGTRLPASVTQHLGKIPARRTLYPRRIRIRFAINL